MCIWKFDFGTSTQWSQLDRNLDANNRTHNDIGRNAEKRRPNRHPPRSWWTIVPLSMSRIGAKTPLLGIPCCFHAVWCFTHVHPVGFKSPPEHGAGPRDMVSPVPWPDLEKWDLAWKQVLFRGKNCDDPFSDKPKSIMDLMALRHLFAVHGGFGRVFNKFPGIGWDSKWHHVPVFGLPRQSRCCAGWGPKMQSIQLNQLFFPDGLKPPSILAEQEWVQKYRAN